MKMLKVLGQELPLRWSPSFAQSSACPAFLKFRYIDKVDDIYVRVAAERGKAAHGAIADLITSCMEKKTEISDLTDLDIRRAVEKHTKPEIAAEFGNVIQWVELWRERFQIPTNICGVEEKISLDEQFEECRWDQGAYRGIIDLSQVSGSWATITDWKSQPHILSQTELDDPFGGPVSEQMTHYAWLFNKQYPHVVNFNVRVWYLRYGFYTESRRTERDLKMYEEALHLREKKVLELDNWDPIPGDHCQWCDYIRRCPLATNLAPETVEVVSQEQAILNAQRVTVMDALSSDIKGRLKKYVTANDDVRIGDKYVYGYHLQESDYWDAAEVIELLQEHYRDAAEVLRVDVKAMKKFIRKVGSEDEVLAQSLEDLRKTRRKTVFKGSKG